VYNSNGSAEPACGTIVGISLCQQVIPSMSVLRAALALITGLLISCTVSAQSASAGDTDDPSASSYAWLRLIFDVPANLAIDPTLREAGAAIASAHLERMKPVLRAWADEERRLAGTSVNPAVVQRQLSARMVNELSLWQLDQAGKAYDDAFLEAVLKPGVCRFVGADSFFAERLQLLQGTSPASRPALLAGEAELLRRWNAPRGVIGARMTPSAIERADRTIQQLKAGGVRPELPLPPVLAAQLLGPDDSVRALGAVSRCALDQWWLQNSLRRDPSKRDEALPAYRYVRMRDASHWLSTPQSTSAEKATAAAVGYPDLARAYAVEGRITVEALVNAEGKFQQGAVVERDISVPGIRGVRPVAFETLLDDASIERARGVAFRKPDPAELKDGQMAQRIEFLWRLE
jgi:hypothetical protein